MLTHRQLSSAAMIVAAGLLLGRVLGLVRELAIGAICGLTREADLASMAVLWPDLLNTIFMGGGVGAVLVPEFHRLLASEGPRAANQMACQFVVVIGCLAILMAGLLAVFAPAVVAVLAPGLEGESLRVGVLVLRLVVVAVPMCSLVGVTSAMLQARERVMVPAFGNVVLNAVVIGAIVSMPALHRPAWVAISVVTGFAVRLLLQGWECWKAGILAHGFEQLRHFSRLGRDLVRRYLQTFGVVGLVVFIPVIGRAFASHTEGGVACFNYAYKLVELPLGVLGSILALAVFPRICRMSQPAPTLHCRMLISATTAAILLATLPLIVLFQAGAEPIVSLLYQRGALSASHIAGIAAISRIAFWALPALVLNAHITSIFHALRDTRTPFLIGLVILAFCLLSCSRASDSLPQLMVCIVVVQWIHLVALMIALHRSHGVGLCASEEWIGISVGTLSAIGLSLAASFGWDATSTVLRFLAGACVPAAIAAVVLLVSLRTTLAKLRSAGRSTDEERPTHQPAMRRAA